VKIRFRVIAAAVLAVAYAGSAFGVARAATAPLDPNGVPICTPVVQSKPSTITIRTLPNTPHFIFTLDGRSHEAGPDGTATLSTLVPCGVTARLVPNRTPVSIGPGVRAVFGRWYGLGTTQTATFIREYQNRIDFRDLQNRVVDPSSLDFVILRSSLGVRQKISGAASPWLMGLRVVPSAVGLDLKQVYWTVDTVDIGGLNVVNRSQFKFFPEKDHRPRARLLFFTAKIHARDAFFGFPMGTQVKLQYPNGRVALYDLGRGSRTTLNHLPRGDYQITARGPGLRMSRPVSITRDQDVDLKILSYVDLAVVLVAALVFSVGLVWIGRRRRRRRQSGRVAQSADRIPDPVTTARRASEWRGHAGVRV
jgi:hypothetical protein